MRAFQPITRCTTERDARSGDVGADVGVGVRSAVAASGSNGASLRAGSFVGDVGSVTGSVSFPSARPDSALASSRD